MLSGIRMHAPHRLYVELKLMLPYCLPSISGLHSSPMASASSCTLMAGLLAWPSLSLRPLRRLCVPWRKTGRSLGRSTVTVSACFSWWVLALDPFVVCSYSFTARLGTAIGLSCLLMSASLPCFVGGSLHHATLRPYQRPAVMHTLTTLFP